MATHQIIATLSRMETQLYRAESGQRGFLIRGEQEYLDDYQTALALMLQELTTLEKLTANNAAQDVRMVKLHLALDDRIKLFERNIGLKKENHFSLLQNGFKNGYQIDQRIQALTTAINQEELTLLKQRQQTETERADASTYGFGALLIFLIITVPLVFFRFRQNVREKETGSAETARLAAIVDRTPDLIIMSTPEGEMSYFNRAARTMLDLGDIPAAEVKPANLYPSWALDLITRVGIPTAIAKGYWSGEAALLTFDGREIPVSQVIISHRQADGSLSISAIARDIVERKAAEKLFAEVAHYEISLTKALALFNAETNRDKVLQNALNLLANNHSFAAAAFYVWHEDSGSLHLAHRHGVLNPIPDMFKAGEGMVGTAAASRQLQHININPGDAALLLIDTRFGQLPPATILFCPVLFRGDLLGVLALASSICTEDRDDAFIINFSAHLGAALYNIRQLDALKMLTTELRKRSEEIAMKNKQVEQASRMKNEFLATMSHELRTPLNAIIGFSSVIRDGMSGQVTASTAECAQDIYASGQHLLALINDMLDLSTIESGHMKLEPGIIDGAALAASGMSILRDKATAHRISLTHTVSAELSAICLDPRKTRQILFNLLSNALKFTPDGGSIRIDLQRVHRKHIHKLKPTPDQRLFPLPPGECQEFLEIRVTDSGIGISASDLQKLFEPFTQVDGSGSRQYGGTGLGLMMIRRLTELQGGAIQVSSHPGAGSCFSVWLPLHNLPQGIAKEMVGDIRLSVSHSCSV